MLLFTNFSLKAQKILLIVGFYFSPPSPLKYVVDLFVCRFAKKFNSLDPIKAAASVCSLFQ